MGKYINRQIGWYPIGDVGFGPGRYWPAPVGLRPTVRRGLVATFRGQGFDVDFGPRPGILTLHPLAGQPAPPDFTEGVLEVPDAAVDELSYLRKLCTFRDAEFEIIGIQGDQAVLHFLGENYEVAHQLGLTEVGFRQWRTVVGRAELSDVRDEIRPIRRGLFGSEN